MQHNQVVLPDGFAMDDGEGAGVLGRFVKQNIDQCRTLTYPQLLWCGITKESLSPQCFL